MKDLKSYIGELNRVTDFDHIDLLKMHRLTELHQFHFKNCEAYAKIVEALGFKQENYRFSSEIPFLPVTLFKQLDLVSVSDAEIIKKMYSSGTTSDNRSRIYLDKVTAQNQIRVLNWTVTKRIDLKKSPLLLIESPETIKNNANFNARAAGVVGFSMFGSQIFFALNPDMSINYEAIREYQEVSKNTKGLVFGFTSIIWLELIERIKPLKNKIDLANSILIHGGGWKKLSSLNIDSKTFKKNTLEFLGINDVIDYYGMIEQTGSIFMECSQGFLHTTPFNDILIRDHKNFGIKDFGEEGIVQVLSVIPESYPGYSVLTEDLGVVYGENDCTCKCYGKYFKIIGRIPQAEVRGCSDTYVSNT